MEFQPGDFCWIELATSDPAEAKRFYGELLSWGFSDMPVGETTYTLFHMGGCTTAAMYERPTEGNKAPPHWASYVIVESADATTQLVAGLGGTVVREPFDVMDLGRMAVLTDPGGATLCIWQNYKHAGVETYDLAGGLSYNELLTTDVAACQRFYSELFGWQTEEQETLGRRYVRCRTAGGQEAGIREVPEPLATGISGHWLIYIRVEQLELVLTRIKALGGECLVPVSELPGLGRFAVVRDPEGALFAIREARSGV